jgi:hypothetical protein
MYRYSFEIKNFYAEPALRLCIFGGADVVCPAPTFDPLVGPEAFPELCPFCFFANAASIFVFVSSTGKF